ncbi:hypothetical protein ACJVC5_18810 [Peredibacter sp. HCB2-198]|uniref:hypothetical protein n=1 Tax=Peredibacter sp. HCB2-198 TaxID=3383025 RepID=UPI0038B5DB6E
MKTSSFVFTTVSFIACMSAWSHPTVHPSHPESFVTINNIKNSTNSNLLLDDRDPSVIYVLPPNREMNPVEVSLNKEASNDCSEMVKEEQKVQEIEASIENLEIKIEEKEDQISELGIRQLAIVKEQNKLVREHANLNTIKEYDQKLEEVIGLLTEALQQKQKCKTAECKATETEKINQLAISKDEIVQTIDNYLDNSPEAAQYKKLNTEYNDIENLALKLFSENDQTQENIQALEGEIELLDQEIASKLKKSVTVELSFNSNWDENINKIKKENRGFLFEKAQINSASVKNEFLDENFNRYPESFTKKLDIELSRYCEFKHSDLLKKKHHKEGHQILAITYEYLVNPLNSATVTYDLAKAQNFINTKYDTHPVEILKGALSATLPATASKSMKDFYGLEVFQLYVANKLVTKKWSKTFKHPELPNYGSFMVQPILKELYPLPAFWKTFPFVPPHFPFNMYHAVLKIPVSLKGAEKVQLTPGQLTTLDWISSAEIRRE